MALQPVRSTTFPATLPDINTPLIGTEGGPAPAWYRLLQALFNRTNRNIGIDGGQMRDDDLNSQLFDAMQLPVRGESVPLPFAVSVGASPFVYQAPFRGHVNIAGGTVSLVEFSRDGGVSYIALGANLAPVFTGDLVRVTYSVLPTLTMIGA